MILCSSVGAASSYYPYAQRCIEEVVYAEARGESVKGQQAVAYTIINRATQYQQTVCSVARQPGQYVRREPPSSFKLLLGDVDPTHGATHFQRRDMPRWLGLRKYIRIGNHTFYGK
jgi:hypothetical protein